MTLVSTLRDPRISILNSVWWTRGWMYQEGIISRCRLVFTEEQVYWECDGMVTHESLHLPLRMLHTKTLLRMCSYMKVGVFIAKSPFGSFQSKGLRDKGRMEEIAQLVTNFTRRTLKFDEDSLFAFDSISGRYT